MTIVEGGAEVYILPVYTQDSKASGRRGLSQRGIKRGVTSILRGFSGRRIKKTEGKQVKKNKRKTIILGENGFVSKGEDSHSIILTCFVVEGPTRRVTRGLIADRVTDLSTAIRDGKPYEKGNDRGGNLRALVITARWREVLGGPDNRRESQIRERSVFIPIKKQIVNVIVEAKKLTKA